MTCSFREQFILFEYNDNSCCYTHKSYHAFNLNNVVSLDLSIFNMYKMR